MITKEQARALVEGELSRPPMYPSDPRDLTVMDELTIERPWGWVFFYNTARYIETGDALLGVGGNAPYIVNRHTGEIRTTGTAHPIEHYIRQYEASLSSGL
jgi:hypothetical protein